MWVASIPFKVEEVGVVLSASGTEVLARGFSRRSHLPCERGDCGRGLIALVSEVAGH